MVIKPYHRVNNNNQNPPKNWLGLKLSYIWVCVCLMMAVGRGLKQKNDCKFVEHNILTSNVEQHNNELN